MSSDEPAKKPATELPHDRGEASSLMEPMLVREPQRRRDALADLAVNVVGESAALRSSLPPGIVPGLADLVRAMNCYYSNLIEGHARGRYVSLAAGAVAICLSDRAGPSVDARIVSRQRGDISKVTVVYF